MAGTFYKSHSTGQNIDKKSKTRSVSLPQSLSNSGHFRHDYLIKYAYLVKCYLERFTSIIDPEKWTTN